MIHNMRRRKRKPTDKKKNVEKETENERPKNCVEQQAMRFCYVLFFCVGLLHGQACVCMYGKLIL